MIKFFRKIRRKIVEEGNLQKYLVYATGEILLVMIGILLALQVNTWNENKKIAKAESKAIQNLINEFDRNRQDLTRVYETKKSSEILMRKYLETLNNDTLTVEYLASLDRPNIGGYTWNPTNPILNSLLSTGKIDNLRNDSLKFLLTSWNDLVDDYLEQQSMYSRVDILNLHNYEKNKIPLSIMKGNYTLESTSEQYLSKVDISRAREKIIGELEYHNELTVCINRLYIQVMSAQEVIQVSNNIQEMLKIEVTSK